MRSLQDQLSTVVLLADYCWQELELKKELAPLTTAKYKQQLTFFCNWLEGREPSAELGALFIAELRQKGYSRASIRLYYAAIRPFLYWLEIPFDLKLKKIKRLPSYHSHHEFERLLDVVRQRKDNWATKNQQRDLLILKTFALTGIRKTELLSIRCQDINECYLFIHHGKGDKPRVVPLKKTLYAQLTDYIKQENLAPVDRLFPLSPTRLGVIVRGYAAKAGVGFTPHQLRHLFATSLIEKGAHIGQVQELLRHDDPSTTALYLDVVPAHLKETVELLEDD